MIAFVEWLQTYAPTWYWISGLPLVSGWQDSTAAMWIIVILWAVGFLLAFGYTGFWYMVPLGVVYLVLEASIIGIFAALLLMIVIIPIGLAAALTPVGWITGMMIIAGLYAKDEELKLFKKIPIQARWFFILGVPAVIIFWFLPTLFWVGVILTAIDAVYVIACVIAILIKRFDGHILPTIGTLTVTILTPAGGWLWLVLFRDEVCGGWEPVFELLTGDKK